MLPEDYFSKMDQNLAELRAKIARRRRQLERQHKRRVARFQSPNTQHLLYSEDILRPLCYTSALAWLSNNEQPIFLS